MKGQWLHIPGEAIVRRVRAVALGLSALGVKKGDRVALLSENRPDWSVVDIAILSLGAVNVPIYTTQAPEQVRYILEDSGARVLFVSGRKVFRHARPGVDPVETLERVVFFDTDAAAGVEGALSLFELEQTGAQLDEAEPEVFSRALNAVGADDLATVIYTSGTTGEPKGVMLTHGTFVANVESISGSLPILSLGAVNVPIYTTQAVEQVRYILEDSGARVLLVSNRRTFRHARPGVDP
ncbi:MAG TPA: AMP-binding protein, partial [Pyrinomonadaceae bacterium]